MQQKVIGTHGGFALDTLRHRGAARGGGSAVAAAEVLGRIEVGRLA